MRKDALSWFLRNTSPLMMPIEIANQIADLPEADADTTYKVNPTSIIKLGMTRFFSNIQKNKM